MFREHEISSAQFNNWHSIFGGMDALMIKPVKEPEKENKRLKKMFAEERIKVDTCQKIIEGKLYPDQDDVRWRKAGKYSLL